MREMAKKGEIKMGRNRRKQVREVGERRTMERRGDSYWNGRGQAK